MEDAKKLETHLDTPVVPAVAVTGEGIKELVSRLSEARVASVVLTMYFPCVATFVVLFKELGARELIKATAIMVVSTLLVGGILNVLL